MNFFSKHYEKVLLAVLLTVFVILLIVLLQITKSARNISERDLAIRAPQIDYEPVDFSDSKFRLNDVFALKVAWKPIGTRLMNDEGVQVTGVSEEFVSDLVRPVSAAPCPDCKRLIPLYIFTQSSNCPSCDTKLARPARSFNDEADFTIRSSDSDGDGMPNIFELKHDFLNSLYTGDAKLDKDGDGFSNLYEYTKGTKLDDAKSHPPLTDLIYIESARPPQFPAQLESADVDTQKIKLLVPGRTRAREVSVGNTLTLERRAYTLMEVLSPTSAKIKLNSNNKDFVVNKDESTEIPEEEIEIMNLATNRPITGVKVGTVFEIGTNASGREKWKVISMDMAQATAVIENTDGKTYVLTSQSKISTRARKSE